jgi:flagellin-like protein
MKGLSPIIAAVILIAITMTIAGILSFWATGFMKSKLAEVENTTQGTDCLAAKFVVYSSTYNNKTKTLYTIVDNRMTIDLVLENLYIFYPDNKLVTKPLNLELNSNVVKELNITDVPEGFTNAKIKSNCPEVFVDFIPTMVTK